MIKLYFNTVDGIRERKVFKTLKGARKFTWQWVGKNAEIGSCYAVSCDGIVTVSAEGCTLEELFDVSVPEALAPKTDDREEGAWM